MAWWTPPNLAALGVDKYTYMFPDLAGYRQIVLTGSGDGAIIGYPPGTPSWVTGREIGLDEFVAWPLARGTVDHGVFVDAGKTTPQLLAIYSGGIVGGISGLVMAGSASGLQAYRYQTMHVATGDDAGPGPYVGGVVPLDRNNNLGPGWMVRLIPGTGVAAVRAAGDEFAMGQFAPIISPAIPPRYLVRYIPDIAEYNRLSAERADQGVFAEWGFLAVFAAPFAVAWAIEAGLITPTGVGAFEAAYGVPMLGTEYAGVGAIASVASGTTVTASTETAVSTPVSLDGVQTADLYFNPLTESWMPYGEVGSIAEPGFSMSGELYFNPLTESWMPYGEVGSVAEPGFSMSAALPAEITTVAELTSAANQLVDAGVVKTLAGATTALLGTYTAYKSATGKTVLKSNTGAVVPISTMRAGATTDNTMYLALIGLGVAAAIAGAM